MLLSRSPYPLGGFDHNNPSPFGALRGGKSAIRKYMVRRLIIATTVAISPLYALAQGLITGSIKDARNGDALIGATVIVKSEIGKGAVTDVDGKFQLQTKKEAPLTLRVEYVG